MTCDGMEFYGLTTYLVAAEREPRRARARFRLVAARRCSWQSRTLR